MRKERHLKKLDHFVDEQYGKIGTTKRDKVEKGYQEFKQRALIHEINLERNQPGRIDTKEIYTPL